MEALAVGEFRGQIHRATIATRPQEPSRTLQTVALSATPPLPPFSADRVYGPREKAVRVSSVDREATSVEIRDGLRFQCPECSEALQHAGGCIRCADCGYSQCE